MKKSHLLLLSILFFIAKNTLAQPVLTDPNCNPQISESFILRTTNSVSPGSAGANQTWNLSGMAVTNTYTATVISVVSTPSPSFPGANLSIKTGTAHYYYKTSASSLQYYGALGISYNNPIDELHYPMSFNDSYVDNFVSAPFTPSMAPTMISKGSLKVTADGHGTLISPAGTFSNVMRVHLYSLYKDSVLSNGFEFSRTRDEYRWYQPGTHYHLAMTDLYGGSYIENFAGVGIKEQVVIISNTIVYPVPASDVLTISFANGFSEKIETSLYNSLGQKLKTLNQPNTPSLNINVSDLPEGVYFIRITNLQDNTSVNKRFIISR